jgi:uncharacterized lipoprotein YmbA
MKARALLGSLGPALLVALLWACATTAPTRFYLLSTPPKPVPGVDRGPCVVLGIGPVEIPAYLDRLQIVVRVGPNEIQPSDFDQWGEPLGQGIARVLAEGISREMCVQRVEYFPWKSFSGVDYQVTLRVGRFEASPGQRVELLAQWGVYGSDPKRLLAEGSLDLTEPIGAGGYEEMVAAQSRLLQVGARQIARAILQAVK